MDTVKPSKAGDSLRAIADRIEAQNAVEKMALARILGAAAAIAENHDRLITEVSETLQADLD